MTDQERKLWLDVFICKVQHHGQDVETSANTADRAVKRYRQAPLNIQRRRSISRSRPKGNDESI